MKQFLKIYELPKNQHYYIDSIGATTREFRTPSYNLRGTKDGILYRRVIGTKALITNVEKHGLGITIELLEDVVINGFTIVNLRIVKKSPKQFSLF